MGCFKRKRSLTPAYGPAASDTANLPPSPETPIDLRNAEAPAQASSHQESALASPAPGGTNMQAPAQTKNDLTSTAPGKPDGKEITSATFTISTTPAPRTAKITSASALAYGVNANKTPEHMMYGSRPDNSRFPPDGAADMYRCPSIPVANSRVIWGGSPGPGPYGDYKPVSVLDNRSYTKSTGNLTDFDYLSGAGYDRGGTRSRPMTPSSTGYGTVDRMSRGGQSGARTPTSPYIACEKIPKNYSGTGSLRSAKGLGASAGGGGGGGGAGGRVGAAGGSGRSAASAVSQSSVSEPPSGRASLSKTLCEHCGKKCSGEVLRVQDKYFHVSCFSCKGCNKSLAQGGFFTRGADHYCTSCYQSQFGQRCVTCGQYVEGEVVSALGNTYHQKCFTCARCRQPFPSGERVTYTGKECLCQRCFQIPVMDSQSPAPSPTHPGPKCAGCHEELLEGQALIALDRQWHIWCFKCAACGTLLHGEYMGKDGQPYCEKDYQSQFGVRCAYCERFISGKVLQAGDNHHFHPTCARCTKCGDPFGDGEEMYLQGTAIWHPRCGPGPTESGTVINGHAAPADGQTNGHTTNGHTTNGHHKSLPPEKDLDGVSSTASETQLSGPYRTCSPGLILREYNKSNRGSPVDISRIYTYSYLAAEPSQGYLKKPIDPYDRPPKSPHFHRPPGGDTPRSRPPLGKVQSRTGMRVLVNQIQSETPRPKSPHMNNEEPINLAHFPGGQKPKQNQPSRIEREDFPAPPYPYTDPDRRRRWSGSSKGVSVDESEEQQLDLVDGEEPVPVDPKLKREEEELVKISSGIGKVFLQQVREREKVRAFRATHLDPRNASRTPSATREPTHRLRYDASYNASPSRVIDGTRWTDDEYDGHPSHRSSGRSSATLPSYSVVSSLRTPPKPGYGFRSSTLPNFTRSRPHPMPSYHDMNGDTNSLTGMGDKTHSTDFSSARSDVSASSLTDADRSALTGGGDLCPSATYSSGLRGYSSSRYSPHLRRSLPNMLHPHHPHPPHHIHNTDQPPKIYPAHLLFTTNYRLPNDVDRCHLERHLSDQDFEMVFRMPRADFYRLPEWQRNEFKRRCHFF